jgi:uncharacterized protein YnzC (UPF0291/DUF896 family)
MRRTNVHLSTQQLAQLAKKAKATGLTVAELIRRAIDAYLRSDR